MTAKSGDFPGTGFGGYKRLFHNIFHNKKWLYVIMPFYTETHPDPSCFGIEFDGQNLALSNIIKNSTWITFQILCYEFDPPADHNQIRVLYRDFTTVLSLSRERQLPAKQNIALTTLFKDDAALIDPLYEYYAAQGIEHFFLYYNGIADDRLKNLYDRPGITLMDWNYAYWNDATCVRRHHAQPTQMNDALYRFGKRNFQYMIFCDLDEYLHIPGTTLGEQVASNDWDKLDFRSCWCDAPWDKSILIYRIPCQSVNLCRFEADPSLLSIRTRLIWWEFTIPVLISIPAESPQIFPCCTFLAGPDQIDRRRPAKPIIGKMEIQCCEHSITDWVEWVIHAD